jgi:acetolactate synthase-1/2/3 large subunit
VEAAVEKRVITGNELVAAELKALGVEVTFGLMSDDTATLIVALEAIGIAFQSARQETQAVVMAEGYAFATGRLGVVVNGRGPASTNSLTGAVHVNRTGSKVLIVLGDDPVVDPAANAVGPDLKGIGALGANGIFTAAGLRTFPVTAPGALRPVFAQAAAYAEKGRTAVLHLTTTVLGSKIEVGGEPAPAPARETYLPAPAVPEAIEAAVAVLAQSRRPLILAGWGAHRSGACETLEQLADRIGAVVCTSLKAKDMFRGNPYDCGLIGTFSHSAGRRLIDQADCVLVVGAGLNLLTMSFGASLPPVPIIQVDAVRSNIGRWTTVQVALVGDSLSVSRQLLEALPERPADEKPFHTEETRRLLADFDHREDYVEASVSRGVDPRSLAIGLNELLPEKRTVVYDSGNFLHIVPYLTVPDPDHVKMTAEGGSIGLGIGTAMGVARGRPDTPTVLVAGDGGLLMSLGELESVAREDLSLVIVVMNDHSYGAERHFLELRDLPIAKSMFPEIDFAAMAAELGYETATVASLDDLRALAPLLADPSGPILIDCLINPAIAAPVMAEFAEYEQSR